MSVDQGSAVALEGELVALGWALAERLYREWQSRQPEYPEWEQLDVTSQESLAVAFATMLAKDIVQVGPQL